MDISLDKAKALLDSGIAEAQELIKEPSKVDDVLFQLENRLKDVPAIGETLSDLPVMISMVKGYITKEYTEVSPKVVASLLCAVLYLLKGKDLIKDSIPVVGYLDDIAVTAAAFKLSENELAAYEQWRAGKAAAAAEPAESIVRTAAAQIEETEDSIEASLDNVPSEA